MTGSRFGVLLAEPLVRIKSQLSLHSSITSLSVMRWLTLIAVASTLALRCDGAPCDLTKLDPVLQSPDMLQCQHEESVFIPVATPSSKGLSSVSESVCWNPACGRAITAIKALGLGECQLTYEGTYIGGRWKVDVNLKSEHLNVLDAACGGKYVTDAKSTLVEPEASNPSAVCTTNAVRSVVNSVDTQLKACAGTGIENIISPLGVPKSPELMQKYIDCSQCPAADEALRSANITLPTCRLEANVSYAEYMNDVFAFCEAKKEMETNSYTVNAYIQDKVMNSSKYCATRALDLYFHNEEKALGTCSSALFSPMFTIGDIGNQMMCTSCPQAPEAMSKRVLPKCLLESNVTFDVFAKGSLGFCAPSLKFDAGEMSDSSGGGSALGQDVGNPSKLQPTPSPSTTCPLFSLFALVWSVTGLAYVEYLG
ncbi:hypothetical protein Poli38472_008038 [Pythium oligandrum]|uniref:Uncharacterized protein n=1 Tax=Pythium oligandrum TaxID=41045 RepID=A0A8K1CMJ0_PYTOL|nr:hypothetical protein Poli38472_008038 [Pythium oligandrum]|eukprot:TMW65396.1 hypothetical protein Poli38472_008038 [Pythium oligandrum]